MTYLRVVDSFGAEGLIAVLEHRIRIRLPDDVHLDELLAPDEVDMKAPLG
jgi:hypothetical protein